jgi:hypothetical protein
MPRASCIASADDSSACGQRSATANCLQSFCCTSVVV